MRTKTRIKQSFRFTQWSRKSYAAFKSVGRHVTIGALKNIVADTLLGKQKNMLPQTEELLPLRYSKIGSREDPPLLHEMQLQLLISVLQQEEMYCADAFLSSTIKIYRWLRAFIDKAFSHFFIRITINRLLIENL